MRLHVAALLAVATLLASATAEFNSKTAVTPEVPAAIRAFEGDVPASRLLRTGTVTDADKEERGIVESVTNALKSSAQKKLQSLLNSGKSADDAFSFLKLDHVDDVGDKLLQTSNFRVWVKYIEAVEANPQTVVLAKLKSYFGGDGKLAEKLQQLQKTSLVGSRTKKTATRWQNAQFEQWASKKWTSADVVDDVFKIAPAEWSALSITSSPRQVRKLYSAFLKKFHPELVY